MPGAGDGAAWGRSASPARPGLNHAAGRPGSASPAKQRASQLTPHEKERALGAIGRPPFLGKPRPKATKRELSADELKDLRDAFDAFDVDKTGVIDARELKVALRALGFPVKKAEVRALLEEHAPAAAEDGAAIDFAAFAVVAGAKLLAADPLESLAKAFRLFDEDGRGRISFANLKKAVRDLGEKLPDDEVAAMIAEFDDDKDGAISQAEFFKIMLYVSDPFADPPQFVTRPGAHGTVAARSGSSGAEQTERPAGPGPRNASAGPGGFPAVRRY